MLLFYSLFLIFFCFGSAEKDSCDLKWTMKMDHDLEIIQIIAQRTLIDLR